MESNERGRRLGEQFQSALLLVVLVSAGIAAWMLQARPELSVDVTPLESFPDRLGQWQSIDVPLEPAIESALDADLNVQRVYQTRMGDMVWFYVGYYGTEAGGRPEHTPRFCYPAAGWGIQETRVLDAGDADGLRVNEYVLERGDQLRLVHFWYRSHRQSGLLGGFDQNIDRLIGRLLVGRADGALVRLSTPIGADGLTLARTRLLGFGSRVDAVLGDHWPRESAFSDAPVAGSVIPAGDAPGPIARAH